MRIVVFGAGGFVGGWICEEIAARDDIELLACIRNWASAVRIARRGVPIARVDLTEAEMLAAAVAGADVVVNAMMPPPGREAEIADGLLAACMRAGVARFIHFSSIAVYGEQTGTLDETAALSARDDYGRGKARTEARLIERSRAGQTQLVILRPSIIYGSFSETWTVRFAQRIVRHRWHGFGAAGAGTCNLVHARDVVRAVLAAAQAPQAHEPLILNVNGPEAVTWNEYVRAFAEALGVRDGVEPNATLFAARVRGAALVRYAGRTAKSMLNEVIMRAYLGPGASGQLMQGADAMTKLYPSPDEMKLWRRAVFYSSARAGETIGFGAAVPLAEGLVEAAAWCRLHGVIADCS